MNFKFSDTLESRKTAINYCKKFRDEETRKVLSRYRWDELCADIRESLSDSFLKFRRGTAALEHNGMVIAQNDLVKIVVRDIDGCNACLGVVIAKDCAYPQLARTHLDGYNQKHFESLYHLGYAPAALPLEHLQDAA